MNPTPESPRSVTPGSGTRLFLGTSWLPLASWFLVDLYADSYRSGLAGGIAVAPLYLLPLGLSAGMLAAGIACCEAQRRAGGSLLLLAPATLLAGSLAIWFGVRFLYLSA